MAAPAAKQGDQVLAIDTHIVLIPSPAGPVPTPVPMPFTGVLTGSLSATVVIDEQPAATAGSTAQNTPAHVPAGGPFQKPPTNQATIQSGSSTVMIDDKQAARTGDPAITCNDPADAPKGKVIGGGTVIVGG
jgi:uncharacterized Zn-binding protein involved in type VI secretion